MNLFQGLQLHGFIRQAQDDALDAKRDVRDQGLQVHDLAQQVQRLTSVVIALAELLRDQHGTSEETIEAKVREVEQRGVSLRPKGKRCSACGRVSSPKRADCMFCGEPLPSEHLLAD